MGWTTTYKPHHITAKDYLLHHTGCFKWSDESPYTFKVLDSAIVNLREFYAAVEKTDKETGEREVWAAVFMLNYYRDPDENFGWKDMDESMGPVICNCPERILDLLTPTEYEHAKEWRQRCRDKIAARKGRGKIKPGCTITLHGKDYRVVDSRGRRGFYIVGVEDHMTYRLSHVKARQVTKVVYPS